MACIEPDGSLTVAGTALVNALAAEPLTPQEIAQSLSEPIFKVRGNLRELTDAGLIEEKDGSFTLTDEGRSRI